MHNSEYAKLEEFMLQKMYDSAHDRLHVYRVLCLSLDIAAAEPDAKPDILIAAALLHDIGRAAQLENLELDHAEIGAAEAHSFLLGIGWDKHAAAHVRDCVMTHRFRQDRPPATIEAKILFDADKLDVSGVVGVARTLLYCGQIGEPLYNIRDGELVTEGARVEAQSFVEEYNYKLKNIYGSFHTQHARGLAAKRQASAEAFYEALTREIAESHIDGQQRLDELLT